VDGDILTTLLNNFKHIFMLGNQRLIPDARWLLLSFVTIELALLGMRIALNGADETASELVNLAWKTTLYLFLITNWTFLTNAMIKGFVGYGLHASGGVISETDFTDPSKLVWFGISVSTLVYNRIFAYTGWDVLYNLPDILFTGVAASLCLYAFARFGLEVFSALLEFYCVGGCVVILIAFGMLRHTAFLAEKALALMWAYGVKLLVMAFVAGAALFLMKGVEPGLNPKFGQVVTLAGMGFAIVYLAHRVNTVAQALLYGSPQLTAQDLMQFVKATTQTIVTAITTAQSLAPTPNTAGPPANRRPL